ncbi:hypothetical protein BV25DRAFT_644199 [Artomyces pyxidatus]|uniref:Uncharacterized protein n=1 Tax=Artomyces pyxidatus TaxID=48021 RepID=A0ACB8T2V9_9AGAM|nr:hypothetical protein BV25DRAFT_644199 [Artomyces pyxidatus]
MIYSLSPQCPLHPFRRRPAEVLLSAFDGFSLPLRDASVFASEQCPPLVQTCDGRARVSPDRLPPSARSNPLDFSQCRSYTHTSPHRSGLTVLHSDLFICVDISRRDHHTCPGSRYRVNLTRGEDSVDAQLMTGPLTCAFGLQSWLTIRNGPRIAQGPDGPCCFGSRAMIDGPGVCTESELVELHVSTRQRPAGIGLLALTPKHTEDPNATRVSRAQLPSSYSIRYRNRRL